jgi:hypothetical protein
MSEPHYDVLEPDTFYLIGYGWDSRDSWSAIYELNLPTVEKLIVAYEWANHYQFDFNKFPRLETIVFLNYYTLKELEPLIKKALKNPNIKKIVLRKCSISAEGKAKFLKKYKNIKLEFED